MKQIFNIAKIFFTYDNKSFEILFANKSTTSNKPTECMWKYTFQMMIYISYSLHYSSDNKNELTGSKSYRPIKTWTSYRFINVTKNFYLYKKKYYRVVYFYC